MKAFVIATQRMNANGMGTNDGYLYAKDSSSYTFDIRKAMLLTTEESAGSEALRQSSLPRVNGRRTFWPVRVEVTTEGVVKDD